MKLNKLKFIIISFIVFIFSLEALHAADGGVIPLDVDEITKLRAGIEEVERKLNDAKEMGAFGNLTVLIGATGSGKTTLLNCLHDKEALEAVRNAGERTYKLKKNQGIGEVVAGGLSGTTQQGFYKINDEWYCDCPGFGDTRGPFQDLLNSYAIYKLFSNVNNIRVVCIAAYPHLQDRREKFITLINQVSGIFQDGLDDLFPHVSFIRTKIPSGETREDHLAELREILELVYDEQSQVIEPGRQNFHRYKMKLLSFFKNSDAAEGLSPNKIGFFYAPSQSDCQRKNSPSDTDLTDIVSAINSSSVGNGQQNQLPVHISVSADTQLYIRRFYTAFRDDIMIRTNALIKYLPVIVTEFVRGYIGQAAELRRELTSKILDPLSGIVAPKKLLSDKITHINEILSTISNMTADTKIKDEIGCVLRPEIQAFSSVLTFIDSNLHEIAGEKLSLDNIWRTFEGKVRGAQSFLERPRFEWTGNKKDHLIAIGCIVGLSDVNAHYDERKITKLDIYSPHTFFLDDSLTLPGCDMAVLADFWKGNREKPITINLRGSNDGVKEARSLPDKNFDGIPGEPGLNGGCFYGFGKLFLGITNTNFTIDVRGGNGRDGLNGVSGARGRDGIDGEADDIRDGKLTDTCQVFRQHLKIGDRDYGYIEGIAKSLLTYNGKFREVYLSKFERTRGERGGDAGKGGIGGYGGRSGTAVVEGLANYNYSVSWGEGKVGKDGKPGASGEGGKHGAIFGGVKLVEYILPSVRRIGEIGDDKQGVTEAVADFMKTVGSSASTAGAAVSAGVTVARSIAPAAAAIAVDGGASGASTTATVGAGLATGGVFITATIAVQSIGSIISANVSTKWVKGWEPQKIAPAEADSPTDEETECLKSFKKEARLVLEKKKAASESSEDELEAIQVPHPVLDQITLEPIASSGIVPSEVNEEGRREPLKRTTISQDDKQDTYKRILSDFCNNEFFASNG